MNNSLGLGRKFKNDLCEGGQFIPSRLERPTLVGEAPRTEEQPEDISLLGGRTDNLDSSPPRIMENHRDRR